jgi:hypothetical protein
MKRVKVKNIKQFISECLKMKKPVVLFIFGHNLFKFPPKLTKFEKSDIRTKLSFVLAKKLNKHSTKRREWEVVVLSPRKVKVTRLFEAEIKYKNHLVWRGHNVIKRKPIFIPLFFRPVSKQEWKKIEEEGMPTPF